MIFIPEMDIQHWQCFLSLYYIRIFKSYRCTQINSIR